MSKLYSKGQPNVINNEKKSENNVHTAGIPYVTLVVN